MINNEIWFSSKLEQAKFIVKHDDCDTTTSPVLCSVCYFKKECDNNKNIVDVATKYLREQKLIRILG